MKIVLKYKKQPHVIYIDNEDYLTWGKYHLELRPQKFSTKLRVILRYGRKQNGRKQRIYLHRFIMKIDNPKIQVDHINGNPLDNRKCNLRLCNNKENNCNRPVQKNNKTGYKGVRFHKQNKNYTAQIQVDGKSIYLGSFSNPIDAAKVYDKAALKYFKEFARLNFEE